MRTTRLMTACLAFGLLSVALCFNPATASAQHGKNGNGGATSQPSEHQHKHKHKHKHEHGHGTTNPSGQKE